MVEAASADSASIFMKLLRLKGLLRVLYPHLYPQMHELQMDEFNSRVDFEGHYLLE